MDLLVGLQDQVSDFILIVEWLQNKPLFKYQLKKLHFSKFRKMLLHDVINVRSNKDLDKNQVWLVRCRKKTNKNEK